MPRRTFHVFTNQHEHDGASSINVYYCLFCTSHAVITNVNLASAPRRRTDGAIVLRDEVGAYKLNLVPSGCKLIRRSPKSSDNNEGDARALIERQYRLSCKGCGVFVAYTSTPPSDLSVAPGYLYILPDALSTRPDATGAIKSSENTIRPGSSSIEGVSKNLLESDKVSIPNCIASVSSDSGLRIAVRVVLRSAHNQIVSIDDDFVVIELMEKREGKANNLLVTMLSNVLGIPRHRVVVDVGHQSMTKVLQVKDIKVQDALKKVVIALNKVNDELE